MGQIKLVALLAAATCLPLAAQENWCSNRGGNDGMVTHSEVREQHLPVAGQNVVNPEQNGSIHVHGWANSDILVKACVQASAHDEGTAEMLAKQVTIADGAGQIVARGPGATGDNEWWSVSYDIWVPASANLQLEANNGSIHVEGTLGQIRGHTENGSVTLRDVGGDVEVETTNGSLNINPTSASSSQTKGLKLKTVNGSIHLQLPSDIGAEVEASTVNGSVKSDFADSQDPKEKHNLRFTIGAGGPRIEAETVNGSVHITRQI